MPELSLISNAAAKVFGHLYIAVFSNGTVKAGMAKSSPQDRVTSHAHSGKAFGIGLETAFYASIYTNDIRARERLMHEEIGALAVLTAGREWFKFSSVDAALNFASAYCCRVERMSFSERPSPREIESVEAANSGKSFIAKALFDHWNPNKAVTFYKPPNAEDLQSLEKISIGYGQEVTVMMARRIIDLEERLLVSDEKGDSGMPVLASAINQYLDGALQEAGADADFQSKCRALECMTLDAAISIVKAAACYPNFFAQSLRVNEVSA